MIIWNKEERPAAQDILNIYDDYVSNYLHKIETYRNYYEVENADITRFWRDRNYRSKKPNNLIPTAYYKTIVDSMSGYMFNNVAYEPVEEVDANYVSQLNDILNDNNVDIKDMATGINALYCNKGVELVYTVGDGRTPAEIKYTSLDPRSVIIVYTDDIEPEVFFGIYITKYGDIVNLDVIYNSEWQYYTVKENKISQRKEPRILYFSKCPICVYRADMVSDKAPFHQIIKYIDALDMLLTGNSNEIDKLFDAILIIGKQLTEEQKKANLSEWKLIDDMRQEDRAEFLERDMSPEFREYVSKLLAQEIHKHSHVIDWASPDSGISGAVSAKSLKTRLFDMNMYSNRIEKIYKEGAEKRIELITEMMNAKGMPIGEVNIIFNRSLPSEFEDLATVLKDVGFLSDQTKCEKLGIDWETEKARREEELPDIEPVEREIPVIPEEENSNAEDNE
jgi:SPP1 family phage portal protein